MFLVGGETQTQMLGAHIPDGPKYATWHPAPRRKRQVGRWVKTSRAFRFVAAALLWMECSVVLSNPSLNPDGIDFWVVVAWVGLVWYMIALWRRGAPREAPPELLSLCDVPATVTQFPVSIRLFGEGWPYASDTGLVSLVDGWMHFQGLSTSFALHASEATWSPIYRIPYFRKRTRIVRAYQITWSHKMSHPFLAECEPVHIVLTPYDSLEGLGSGMIHKLQSAVLEWSSHRSLMVGTPVYPPLTPKDRRAVGYAIGRVLGWVGVGVGLFLLGWSWQDASAGDAIARSASGIVLLALSDIVLVCAKTFFWTTEKLRSLALPPTDFEGN